MIRTANVFDLFNLVEFCMECNDSMPWASFGLEIDAGSVNGGLLDFIYSDMCDLSVVEESGKIVGVCAVSLQPYALNKKTLVASEWIWHARPSYPDGISKRKMVIRMLDHMLTWARRNGAHVFKATTQHTDKALADLLSRRGITPMETACVGRL